MMIENNGRNKVLLIKLFQASLNSVTLNPKIKTLESSRLSRHFQLESRRNQVATINQYCGADYLTCCSSTIQAVLGEEKPPAGPFPGFPWLPGSPADCQLDYRGPGSLQALRLTVLVHCLASQRPR